MPVRDHLKLILFMCQESALDAATPGAEAKARYIRNSQVLKDTAEAMVAHCYGEGEIEVMYKEIWQDYPDSLLNQDRTARLTQRQSSRKMAR